MLTELFAAFSFEALTLLALLGYGAIVLIVCLVGEL